MLSDILRWGGRRSGQPDPSRDASQPRAAEMVVPSKAFPKFLSAMSSRPEGPEAPVLLDFGPVIGTNVAFFGEHLGCKLFIEDLFADFDRQSKAGTLKEMPGTLESRFRHADASVDGILCWDYFDFLSKPAAEALAKQIIRMLRPGGSVMGFFCTSSLPMSPFTKYEIVDKTSLRHKLHPGTGGPKHAFLNRDIIKMFDGLVVAESFLLKSNTREILLRSRS